jgi:hypothetical protein
MVEVIVVPEWGCEISKKGRINLLIKRYEDDETLLRQVFLGGKTLLSSPIILKGQSRRRG